MFSHHKELAYTVRVDKPNPVFGRMLQQAIGGQEGELRVMTQYLFQGWGYRGPAKYRDMLLSTATEEIGHVELLATAVAMNLEGAKSEMVDEVVTNPAVAARMGGLEPRHYLTAGLAAMPSDANGVPWTAASVDTAGNLAADMHANVGAEAVGRTLASRLRELTDDPGMKDMLSYLIARDTMHMNQWLAVLEELGPQVANNAPGDVPNEGDHADHAYEFVHHAPDGAVDPDARWLRGPAYDGIGEFRGIVDPQKNAGPEPRLQPAPPEVHAGIDATDPSGGSAAGTLMAALGKVMPSG
jgi:Mn-containing catalase